MPQLFFCRIGVIETYRCQVLKREGIGKGEEDRPPAEDRI